MPTYAEIRKQELKHIEQSLKDDRKMKRELQRYITVRLKIYNVISMQTLCGLLLKRMSAWLKLNVSSVRQMLKRSNR